MNTAQAPSVLVIGDIILDHYLLGKVDRISPEAPVPVVHIQSENYVLGGAANVAHNLAKLQISNALIGATGKDAWADMLTEMCRKLEIQDEFIRTEDMPTIRKSRVIGGKQQIARIDFEQAFTKQELALEKVKSYVKLLPPKVLVLSDYGKGMIQSALSKEMIYYANELQLPLIIDPKGKDWTKYAQAYLITPNLKELAEVYGENLDNTNIAVESAGKEVMKRYGLQNLLVTRSENGMTLFLQSGEVQHFPSQKVEVFDVSGAGDTVVAVLAASLSEGKSLIEATKISNLAGGFVVSKFGTYAISKEELTALL